MVFTLEILVESIWFILPAFAANGLAPLVGLKENNHVIDCGKKLGGKRLLGNGKTWEGLFFGALVGALIGTLEMLVYPYLPWELSAISLTIIQMSPLLGFVLGFGAMSGDLIGSFVKRRIGKERGSPVPLLDQLDFIFGALLFTFLIVQIKIEWILLLVVLTPIIHLISNMIGFRIGVKKTPW